MVTRLDRMTAAKRHLTYTHEMISTLFAIIMFYHGKEAAKITLASLEVCLDIMPDDPEGPPIRQCVHPDCKECNELIEKGAPAKDDDDTDTDPEPLTDAKKEVEH